jgi:hypothetical protein
MAQEIKNTFLKSKMNKDLDDRLLPNGEYRDANNISVGRSEDSDVGALENVIGNALLTVTNLNDLNYQIIGQYSSDLNNSVFVFLTDYTDPNPSLPTEAPVGSKHFIYQYNSDTNEYIKLVEGMFLNFSKTNRIIGINLIEDLLFWTDNRNQPRKINIKLANSSVPSRSDATTTLYYTEEHQISVAKYSPFKQMDLYNKITVQNVSNSLDSFSVAGDQTAELIPYIGATVLAATVRGTNYATVTSVTITGGGSTRCNISPAQPTPLAPGPIELIKSTMTNQSSNENWPGDPNYLEDRFVRFSYRFKYDDNEYSLMAPFTQIAYIPTQKGYFIAGDEDAAYQSTVVQFMKNNVQNIGLIISLPTSGNQLSSNYKIQEIDILFRESGGLAVKVLESIPVNTVARQAVNSNVYTYDYQSRKPYRTLPEAQTVRVYDKVPVRAFSQETAGNRIIYGNYRDQHTPPNNLDYNCRISHKRDFSPFTNFIEYPNHSVKRNRNYQIGFILADKFGRQSPVILSSIDEGVTEAGLFYSGSTIYSPYDTSEADTSIRGWFGDAIQLTLNSVISSSKNLSLGTPGLYASPTSGVTTGLGYAIADGGSIINNQYIFILDAAFQDNANVPLVGNWLRGEYVDYVEITEISITGTTYSITTRGQVSDAYLYITPFDPAKPVLRSAYSINDLGWYSYKIVVKQTQQDYYNAYLPGFLNGYPLAATGIVTENFVGFEDGGVGVKIFRLQTLSLDEIQNSSFTANVNGADTEAFNIVDDTIVFITAPAVGDPIIVTATLTNVEYPTFPTDEINKTAHVVLLNDNINKIPRDLNVVGPDQRQYRSSVRLYGRVNNVAGVSPDFNIFTTQYFPRVGLSANPVNNVASTIATAKELKFSPWETGESSVVNFYQLETNPYIARISTSTSGASNPIGVVTANMTPILTIYETEAVESLLNIYWETTSAGLITDLNTDVLTDFPGPTNTNDIVFTFPEDKIGRINDVPGSGGDITNPIEVYDSEGQTLTDVAWSFLGAINQQGDNVYIFDLKTFAAGDPNYGKAKITLASPIAYNANSQNIDTFYITLNAHANGSSLPVTISGSLTNVKPVILIYDEPIPYPSPVLYTRIINEEDVTVFAQDETGPIHSVNGSANNTTNEESLVYSFEEGLDFTSGWTIDSSTGIITQVPFSTPVGTYYFDIIVRDAGGLSNDPDSKVDEFEVKLIVRAARVNTGIFNPNICFVYMATQNPPPDDYGVVPEISRQRGMITSSGNGNSNLISDSYVENAVWYITKDPMTPEEEIASFSGTNSQGENLVLVGDFGGQNKPAKTYYTRFGTNAHTKGVLHMRWNTLYPGDPNYPTQYNVPTNKWGFKNVSYYYRKVGNSQWLELPRSADTYNKQGRDYATESPGGMPSIGGAGTEENPTIFYQADSPTTTIDVHDNLEVYWFSSKGRQGGDPTGKVITGYANGSRISDFESFEDVPDGIEYAIIMNGFVNDRSSTYSFYYMPYAYPTFGDLNYLTCMPAGAENLVDNLPGPYEYKATPAAADWYDQTNPWNVEFDSGTQFPLYSNIAYGEYVNSFYLDEELTNLYIPQPNLPYINYANVTLQFNSEQDLPYTTYQRVPDGSSPAYAIPVENLVWAAGFTNGTKDMDTPGVGSVQVTKINTAEDPSNNGVRADQVEFRGTIRVNLTNQGSVVPGE